MISFLLNSYHYFIDCVFILAADCGCRLVVNHQGEVLTDKYYDSIKGARIAFSRLYGRQAWRKTTRPDWSHFYQPEKDWLKNKLTGKP